MVFAAGHLPAAAPYLPFSAGFVVRTLAFNAVAGLVFGWQFRRHDLETAMVSHAGLHVGLAVFANVTGASA